MFRIRVTGTMGVLRKTIFEVVNFSSQVLFDTKLRNCRLLIYAVSVPGCVFKNGGVRVLR